MAGYRRLEDLDITRDELNEIGEAMKKEEFRKLLVEYVEEINDPENKKTFQKEVTQLEKERGFDVTFVNPEPGYVIKTSVEGEKKAFINICQSDKVQRPTSLPSSHSGTFGRQWSLPYTQAPPKDDLDKTGNLCVIYDVVFHPEAHEHADRSLRFRNMMNDTALDAVEKNFNVQLDRKNLKFPKMKYKGVAVATVIRKKSSTPPPKTDDDEDDVLKTLKFPYDVAEDPRKLYATKKTERKPYNKESSVPDKTPYTTPKYSIKHRNSVDYQECTNDRNAKLNATLPNEIIVEIELPLLNSTSEATLDVTEKSLSLLSEKPAKYKLNIALPYTVDEDAGNAKFDKQKRKLCVSLPLKYRRDPGFADFGREDSGVESDIGPRTPESSSGEDDSMESETHKFSRIEEISTYSHYSETDENAVAKNKQFVSDLDNEVFRTNMSASKMFLSSDKHYSFPPFTCNVVDNIIGFTLHVKNVDPNSVEHCLFEESCGIHIKFTSIGSGFFPIHHAFCTKFPVTFSIDEDSVSIETWDNNVIVQIQLKSCDTNLFEYYAGMNEDTLVRHDLPEPTMIARQLEDLKISSEDSNQKTDFNIEVTKCTKEETIVEITSLKESHSKVSDLDFKLDDKGSESSEDSAALDITHDKKRSKHPLQKCRTLSESSGDEQSFSPSKKGILKRVSRSLSESSADDYTWSSSLDMIMQSGSDSCIPEEDGKELKKTVRFNEIVHQKTFRTNSSILGQRKKNQRKMRNKKRAQERRASESENSEGEADKEKGRESKTEKEEEAEDEDVNGNDEDVGNDLVEEVIETETKLQDDKDTASKLGGSNPQKTKKKSRKPFVGNQKSQLPKVDLKNDLIFDLDM